MLLLTLLSCLLFCFLLLVRRRVRKLERRQHLLLKHLSDYLAFCKEHHEIDPATYEGDDVSLHRLVAHRTFEKIEPPK